MDCEILISRYESPTGLAILGEMQAASPIPIKVGSQYHGGSSLLMLWGVGRRGYEEARAQQLAGGGHAILWDMGYIGRQKKIGYCRVSIDHQHPQAYLDLTVQESSRWKAHGIALREDANKSGPIILAGVGPKSHVFLGTHGWEERKALELKKRFPGRKIVMRRKPRKGDGSLPIERALQGASLVVCRHSNIAVDACIAGVPFECEDGAASWLLGKAYTLENRLDFLRRLSWWQWKPNEASKAWAFLLGVTANAY